MKAEQHESRPGDRERSAARGSAVTPRFLTAPAWDLSDEEISEWRQTPGRRFAGYTAECIRDGQYDNGQELYPLGSEVYREITRAAVDQAMGMLAERGMVRRSGNAWFAIAPGRLEPSVLRAIGVLLDRRADLPPTLAAELDSWKVTLDTLKGHEGAPASQAATGTSDPFSKPATATRAAG